MNNRTVTNSAELAFRALADPTRRAILDRLRAGRQPVGRIAEAFPVSRPAISKHLRLLRRARLVRQSRQGRQRYYELHAEPLQAVDTWLQHYRVFWRAQLGSLKSFVESHAKPPASGRKEKK